MEIDKEKFFEWLFEKIETLPRYEPMEGDLTEILGKYRDIFEFSRIQKTAQRRTVWVFRCNTNSIIKDDTWGTSHMKNDMTIRIWSDNGKNKLSVEAEICTSYMKRGKKVYHHSNPVDFLEDALEKFGTKTLSTKFGL